MEEYNGKTKLDKMLETYKKYKLDALVILGGNGTHKTANLLAQNGVNVVSLPKTIDNDLWGTDMTFGFQSAVDIATNVIDCIHSTASSHGRVFIVEVMGHKVGWLTLYAGISGGADVILIPEIPYDVDKVCDVLKARKKNGKPFSILAVAEGAGGLPAPSAGFVFYRLTSTISNASMVSPSRISLKFSMPMPHS